MVIPNQPVGMVQRFRGKEGQNILKTSLTGLKKLNLSLEGGWQIPSLLDHMGALWIDFLEVLKILSRTQSA